MIDPDPIDAWHGNHGLTIIHSLHHEHRVDQIGATQAVFTHQTSAEIVPSETAHAARGEAGINIYHGDNRSDCSEIYTVYTRYPGPAAITRSIKPAAWREWY
jgi:hypothetical protein